MTIKEAINYGTIKLTDSSTTPNLDAEVLLCHTLMIDNSKLYQDLYKKINDKKLIEYKKLIKRRGKAEPIAYIVKQKEFYGLNFYVDKRVLIPRPETEVIVDTVLNILKPYSKKNIIKIVDVGTGSGCIPIAIAKNFKTAKFAAIDISQSALQVAKINITKHKLRSRIKLIHGDLLTPLKSKVDVITANLPYLTIEQIHKTEKEIKKYEPQIALLAGENENFLYNKLLKQAQKYINNNGYILLEIDPKFLKKTVKLINQYLPNTKIKIIKDLAQKHRVMIISI